MSAAKADLIASLLISAELLKALTAAILSDVSLTSVTVNELDNAVMSLSIDELNAVTVSSLDNGTHAS